MKIDEATWRSKLPSEPHDHALRWLIPSRSVSDDAYMVDLAGHDEIGTCACVHFQARCAPSIKKGIPKRCFHIITARELYTNWSIHQIAKLDTNKE